MRIAYFKLVAPFAPTIESVIALAAVLAYLIGGLPFGYWFVRLTSGGDIRTMGSGNIGATNVYRTRGSRSGLIVLLLDVLKGWTALYLAAALTGGNAIALGLATVAVMLGHCYPLLLGFKGGKAVACYVGAFLFLAPFVLLGMLVVFVLIVAASRFISLASVVCAALFPLALLIQHPPLPILLGSIASSLLVIYRHRANIQRLRTGSERAFSLRSSKAA